MSGVATALERETVARISAALKTSQEDIKRSVEWFEGCAVRSEDEWCSIRTQHGTFCARTGFNRTPGYPARCWQHQQEFEAEAAHWLANHSSARALDDLIAERIELRGAPTGGLSDLIDRLIETRLAEAWGTR